MCLLTHSHIRPVLLLSPLHNFRMKLIHHCRRQTFLSFSLSQVWIWDSAANFTCPLVFPLAWIWDSAACKRSPAWSRWSRSLVGSFRQPRDASFMHGHLPYRCGNLFGGGQRSAVLGTFAITCAPLPCVTILGDLFLDQINDKSKSVWCSPAHCAK